MGADADIAQVEVGLSEVHLHVGRYGHLVEEALSGSSAILFPTLNVVLNRVARHVGFALLTQLLPNALGGMALLMPAALALLKLTVDDCCIPIHHRRSLLLDRKRR